MKTYKKFNTPWGTVYSRDLGEFTKGEIMKMCPKDVMDIRVLRRDDDNKLMRPSII